MKKIIYSAAIVLCAALTNAQDYTIKMSVKVEGLPAEYAAYGEQEIIAYAKGEKSKSEMNSMMFSSVSYNDGKNITVLSESMGNKSGFTTTKAEIEATEKKDKKENKPTIEYTNEKKMVAGYECTKAILTFEDKEKKETDKVYVWYTDKIKSASGISKKALKRMFEFGDLKGEPLYIEANQPGKDGSELKVVIAATEILTTALDDAIFVPNTDGYTMSTYPEWREKMKAMGGK